MSAIFDQAAALYQACRADYELYRASAYQRAELETGGVMLNAKGKAAEVDAYGLFMGTEARAQCYASDELRDWWGYNGRITYSDYETQWLEAL